MSIFKSKLIVGSILISLLTIILVTTYVFGRDRFYNTPNTHRPYHHTWLFIGDSITRGMFHQDISFVDYFGKTNRLNTINEGHNGWDTLQIINSIDEIDHPANVVSVYIGTNDWDKNVPIGNNGDTDTDTFYGRINTLMNILKEKHSDTDIYFCTLIEQKYHPNATTGEITPANDLGLTLEDYSNAITECAEDNDIEIIDLYKKSGINWDNINSFTVDGSHPNTKGHMKIAKVFMHRFKASPPQPF